MSIIRKTLRFPIRHYLISGFIFGLFSCAAKGEPFDYGYMIFCMFIYALIVSPFGNAMKRAEIRQMEMDYLAIRIAEENANIRNRTE